MTGNKNDTDKLNTKLTDDFDDELDESTKDKKAPKLFRPLLFIIILCFCVFAAVDMIARQNEIEQLEQETEMMAAKLEESKQLNDEYEAMLNADEDEFMQKVAVEQLGYSYPNEKRYYIVNNAEK